MSRLRGRAKADSRKEQRLVRDVLQPILDKTGVACNVSMISHRGTNPNGVGLGVVPRELPRGTRGVAMSSVRLTGDWIIESVMEGTNCGREQAVGKLIELQLAIHRKCLKDGITNIDDVRIPPGVRALWELVSMNAEVTFSISDENIDALLAFEGKLQPQT